MASKCSNPKDRFSERFVPNSIVSKLDELCKQMRTRKTFETLSDSEMKSLASLISFTGGGLDQDDLLLAMKRDLPGLKLKAASLRTGKTIGFMAPESLDRGNDSIQAALWIADSIDTSKQMSFLTTFPQPITNIIFEYAEPLN